MCRNERLTIDRNYMNNAVHNKIVSFIWTIADDCLRDIYVRGKYRDVILPMVVLRRLDSLLELSKEKVLQEMSFQKNEMGLVKLDENGLQDASGYVFYNTSKWTLKNLFTTATNNQQILKVNMEDYLSGFSANVKEIIEKFNLRSQIRHMAVKDVLLDVLEKFTSPYLNLTPHDREDPDGNPMPALTNLGMGYVFEELIRKFNEENNEEAGEHFTPREVIELMTRLTFEPVKDHMPPVITIYDPACGSGGMLTESQAFIKNETGRTADDRYIYLYGKEINDETYAICKSDMMIKGNDPEHIRPHSTLSTDEFAGHSFDFMLSNPPYGKSWASEQKFIKDGTNVIDPRFKVTLKDYWRQPQDVDAVPRSSDGQLLFLMEMVSKMKSPDTSLFGSRIASVHNGSSLFTGDAGSGESNIRRYIIENDLLEAIIQLPNNLFYNTGITTYIWLLSNNKENKKKGKVQLIDASRCFQKLRKNLGNKNCELSRHHIRDIVAAFRGLKTIAPERDEKGADTGLGAKVFENSDFGYHKVVIERPDRRFARFTEERIAPLRFDKALAAPMQWIYEQFADAVYTPGTLAHHEKQILAFCEENGLTLNARSRKKLFNLDTWEKHLKLVAAAQGLMETVGKDEFNDFNQFKVLVDKTLKALKLKLSVTEKKAILNAASWYDETGCKVIKAKVKLTGDKLDKLLHHLGCKERDLADFGFYPTEGKKREYLSFESCSDLRDHESVPLNEDIHDYFRAEVAPHVSEAWINLDSVKIGYEISFNKYFYRHKPLRSMEEVAKDILDLEHQAEGLIADILGLDVAVVSGVGHD